MQRIWNVLSYQQQTSWKGKLRALGLGTLVTILLGGMLGLLLLIWAGEFMSYFITIGFMVLSVFWIGFGLLMTLCRVCYWWTWLRIVLLLLAIVGASGYWWVLNIFI